MTGPSSTITEGKPLSDKSQAPSQYGLSNALNAHDAQEPSSDEESSIAKRLKLGQAEAFVFHLTDAEMEDDDPIRTPSGSELNFINEIEAKFSNENASRLFNSNQARYQPSQNLNNPTAPKLPAIKRLIDPSVVRIFRDEQSRINEIARCFPNLDTNQIKFTNLQKNKLTMATDCPNTFQALNGLWLPDAFAKGFIVPTKAQKPTQSTRVPVFRFRILKEAIPKFRNPFVFEQALKDAIPDLELSLIKWWNIDRTVVSICTDCPETHKLLSAEWHSNAFDGKKAPLRLPPSPIKVIIKNVFEGIDVQDSRFATALASQGLANPKRIFKRGTEIATRFVTAECSNMTRARDLAKHGFRLTQTICCPVEIERRILQCFKCQQFGHGKGECTQQEVCALCSQSHHLSNCQHKNSPAYHKCVNCSGNHPSFSRSCSVVQTASTGSKSNRPQQRTATDPITAPAFSHSNFPQLISSNAQSGQPIQRSPTPLLPMTFAKATSETTSSLHNTSLTSTSLIKESLLALLTDKEFLGQLLQTIIELVRSTVPSGQSLIASLLTSALSQTLGALPVQNSTQPISTTTNTSENV